MIKIRFYSITHQSSASTSSLLLTIEQHSDRCWWLATGMMGRVAAVRSTTSLVTSPALELASTPVPVCIRRSAAAELLAIFKDWLWLDENQKEDR